MKNYREMKDYIYYPESIETNEDAKAPLFISIAKT
jgi:hypothetical protein